MILTGFELLCEECKFPINLNGLNPKNFTYRGKLYHKGCFKVIYIPRRYQ